MSLHLKKADFKSASKSAYRHYLLFIRSFAESYAAENRKAGYQTNFCLFLLYTYRYFISVHNYGTDMIKSE